MNLPSLSTYVHSLHNNTLNLLLVVPHTVTHHRSHHQHHRMHVRVHTWALSYLCTVGRLTISEEGCEQILNHTSSSHVRAKLIQSLGVDEAGRCACSSNYWINYWSDVTIFGVFDDVYSYIAHHVPKNTSLWV